MSKIDLSSIMQEQMTPYSHLAVSDGFRDRVYHQISKYHAPITTNHIQFVPKGSHCRM